MSIKEFSATRLPWKTNEGVCGEFLDARAGAVSQGKVLTVLTHADRIKRSRPYLI